MIDIIIIVCLGLLQLRNSPLPVMRYRLKIPLSTEQINILELCEQYRCCWNESCLQGRCSNNARSSGI